MPIIQKKLSTLRKSWLGKKGCPTTILKLYATAALFHDAGFLEAPGNHEEISCKIARTHLSDFDYSEKEIEQVCELTMCTRLPQKPSNKIGENPLRC
jgi:hypothetical protein